MSYASDRKWSDRFIPRIKTIVGPWLLDVTPDEIDCKQAADLMVFTARDMRIAARVRRSGKDYATRYPFDFTIRARRDNGAETELSKILAGWGDLMFYGHAGGNLDEIPIWWLLDLAEFRQAMAKPEALNYREKPNGDGTHFVAFDVRSFPNKRQLVRAWCLPAGASKFPKSTALSDVDDMPLFKAAP